MSNKENQKKEQKTPEDVLEKLARGENINRLEQTEDPGIPYERLRKEDKKNPFEDNNGGMGWGNNKNDREEMTI